MVAKIILPYFGGGSAVWTACMLFYQSLLLVGYLYSFCISKLKTVYQQLAVHSVLLVVGMALMPLSLESIATTEISTQPFFDIFTLLLLGIGAPYFVLSATSPLLQYWLSHSVKSVQVYRLYSVSNVAAMMALFCYPLIIEYNLALSMQVWMWSGLYIAFSLFNFYCLYQVYRNTDKKTTEPVQTAQSKLASGVNIIRCIKWFLLSATGVILLVSTTNNLTINVPPIPFLWTLPLALYLLTYILCFFDERVYLKWYWNLMFSVVSLVALFLFSIGSQFAITEQICLYLVVLFVACIICHGEIAKSKPGNEDMTLFYLILAAGGCVGSVFASILATELFTQYYEYIVGICLVFVLSIAMEWQKQQGKVERKLVYLNVVGCLVFVSLFYLMQSQFNKYNVYESRNFFGIIQVKDIVNIDNPQRRLIDGYTSHGAQALAHQGKPMPLSYYRPETGVGVMLNLMANNGSGNKVGIIGLGVGALAYYGQAQDEFVFYEINPDVEYVAKRYFNYLTTSAATIDVRSGDARVSLANDYHQNGAHGFDMLIVDAFSSDSIPQHLLTREALALYEQHLAADGVLVFHISNSYLDLRAIMSGIEAQSGLQSRYFKTSDSATDTDQAEWVIFTSNMRYLADPQVVSKSVPLREVSQNVIQWSDNHSSLLSVIKL
ncbi:hypothetical protein CWB89_17175 [Pseudoalteromonas piscicida]|uniref:Integral membrane-like protein n=1 Tax=Pseudoalteromonas piscicida TaxID=43662 RepID=A0AAQ2IS90_PSEO7|nr:MULTISPECIES: fused MFS/spermidine synthase [Pseudoalteromonas]TMN35579.1 hypothetical protein CWB94_20490 [Pseudoalteromonas piscicida]TMN37152.1 hypothetical protein CWB95_16025 [Pseudoalteromonas piscicida]TMN51729.1 hypothetical protein CWB92_11255 [Pseudoalteromonas piscicida]TMN56658.1 hypothetical protein CWB93_10020 [Pseudoalteromonas piscicida]TMN57987.1 hypothetical protein CWB91_02465 [Pseudoalteromonas piscicida]